MTASSGPSEFLQRFKAKISTVDKKGGFGSGVNNTLSINEPKKRPTVKQPMALKDSQEHESIARPHVITSSTKSLESITSAPRKSSIKCDNLMDELESFIKKESSDDLSAVQEPIKTASTQKDSKEAVSILEAAMNLLQQPPPKQQQQQQKPHELTRAQRLQEIENKLHQLSLSKSPVPPQPTVQRKQSEQEDINDYESDEYSNDASDISNDLESIESEQITPESVSHADNSRKSSYEYEDPSSSVLNETVERDNNVSRLPPPLQENNQDPFANIPDWGSSAVQQQPPSKQKEHMQDSKEKKHIDRTQAVKSRSKMRRSSSSSKENNTRNRHRASNPQQQQQQHQQQQQSNDKKQSDISNNWIDPSPKLRRYSVPKQSNNNQQDNAPTNTVMPPFPIQSPPPLAFNNNNNNQMIPMYDPNAAAYMWAYPYNNNAPISPMAASNYFYPPATAISLPDISTFPSGMMMQPVNQQQLPVNNISYQSQPVLYRDSSAPIIKADRETIDVQQQQQQQYNNNTGESNNNASYRTYGIDDYKRQLTQYLPQLNRLGGLGPDLDSDVYVERLKRSLKLKEYAIKVRENNTLNRALGSSQSLYRRSKPIEVKEKEMAAWRRKRMWDYSNSIPKPPQPITQSPPEQSQQQQLEVEAVDNTAQDSSEVKQSNPMDDYMAELERRYNESVSKVDAIRKQQQHSNKR